MIFGWRLGVVSNSTTSPHSLTSWSCKVSLCFWLPIRRLVVDEEAHCLNHATQTEAAVQNYRAATRRCVLC